MGRCILSQLGDINPCLVAGKELKLNHYNGGTVLATTYTHNWQASCETVVSRVRPEVHLSLAGSRK